MSRPLDGILVVDLTRLLPGPFATLQLADLGARIIKIEAPPGGDYARWSPPLGGGMSAIFAALNRDKESVALDLKRPDARAALEPVLARADVIVDSFRPGVMKRLGLDYPTLSARYPGLIGCSITGYGQTGPLHQRAGHDLNYMALAGLADVTGEAQRPVTPGFQAADIAGGALYAVIGITTALYERHRTGRGRFVDVSMTDGVAGLGMMMHARQHLAGGDFGPGQDVLAGSAPCYRIWTCADGRALAVGALEPKFWAALCAAMGRPDLATDGLVTGSRKAWVDAELQAVFATRTRDEWVEHLATHDVCVEPVLSLEEARQTEHARARGLFGEHDHPREGARFLHQFPNPRLLPGAKPPSPIPAPAMGQHTRAVLLEAGVDPQAIDRLTASGAAIQPR